MRPADARPGSTWLFVGCGRGRRDGGAGLARTAAGWRQLETRTDPLERGEHLLHRARDAVGLGVHPPGAANEAGPRDAGAVQLMAGELAGHGLERNDGD